MKKLKESVFILLSILSLAIFSCDSWMKDDDFFSDIENQVKVANAPKINVYVRYAMNRQGKTEPDGYDIFKVGIPHDISASTEPDYGFVRWAAFSTEDKNGEKLFLGTGDNQSQNKDIYFIDDEDYKERILPHELSEEVVTFEDAKNPNTVVTINEERNDIYLMPIIAQRPTLSLTIPANGGKDVVRNMAVRISFTKPMDPESFKNEAGEYDKITITQGGTTFTATGDMELNSDDITDHFIIDSSMFSLNKKMITLKFNDAALSEGYASRSTVTVSISKEVKDSYGFSMAEDNGISFTVGNKKDSLAPRITSLTAGSGTAFNDFQGVYKNTGTIDSLGQMTRITHEGANLAPTADITNNFYDSYILNRIGQDSKLILRIYAEDIAGAGSGQSQDGFEADVTQVLIRAKHLYNADGTEDTEAKMTDPTYYGYVAQQNNTSLSGTYRELVNNANKPLIEAEQDVLDSSYGGLFEYDLSGFPDGLIQVDVSAADVVGNIGFFSSDDEISTEYGNGYASLFIVKDTTSPSAEANKNYVQADLTIVPNGRGFFNAEYYKRLAVVQSGGTIEDSGHARLRAPNAELKWIIVPGSDTNWASTVKADDARWKPVTQSYAPAQSALPTKDGSVDFTYAVMDNLGNISDAVVFKSVTYDNTIPSLSALGMTGINGYVSSSVNDVVLENQILSIPVTDSTAGLEAIEVGITCIKDGVTSEEYASPFASSKLAVKVNGNSTTYKINGKKLTFTNPIVGQSTVTIQGLQIADSNNLVDNSIYRIAVKVTDAAVNTSVQQTKDIKNDTTAPVINSITVNNINSGAVVGGGLEYWTRESTSQTALYINLTETNTGAKVFDFSGSTIKLRSDTSLIWNNTAIPVSVDTSANKLTITDESNTIITAATGGQVIIKNVDLTSAENGNRVSLTITDLVTNKSSAVSRFTLENGSVIDSFRYDAATPVVNSVLLKDQAPGAGGAAESGYTDNEYVEATLNLTSTASGIYQITVSGASFDSTVQVDGKSASDAEAGFAISGNNTIILKTNSGAANRLLKNSAAFNLKLTNVKLPSGDGDKNVSFTVTNLAARTSSAATTSIRLDKTAPAWVGDGVFVAASNAAANGDPNPNIYPHTSTASSGNVKINGTVYFYTSDKIEVDNVTKYFINIAGNISEANRKDDNKDFVLDNSEVLKHEVTAYARTEAHTIYAVDKAGNKSAEKTFYVVQDTSAPAAFDSYVTLPTDNVYRGNSAAADGTANYIVKKADTSKLLVKLADLTSSDKNVDGSACSTLAPYAELNAQTNSSPIEYFAFSTDGSKNWQAIGNGQISIPLTANSTPYTVYLKDGCGNEVSYKIPVNWTVDGTITDIPETSKDISRSSLKANAAKNISYYKGDTTPLVSLIGFNDSCYYPNIDSSTSSETATDNFTLKSRLFVWTNQTSEPTETTYTTSPSFTPWVYLTLKSSSDAASMAMAHHYPNYNVTSAYKLYYVVEDKVGNVLIKQLKNTSDNTELWMYDNTAPTIVPQTAAKVNIIGGVNYYSSNSTISLNITDAQSGIESVRDTHYTGNNVKNSLEAIKYQLDQISPSQDLKISIDGIVDYAGNAMANTEITVHGAGGTWHKQSHPSLATTPVSVIDCTGSSSGTGGTSCGQGNYSASIVDDSSTSGKRIKVQAPRSVTDIKFALDVTCDNEELLGWRITSSALSAADIASDKFYDQNLLGSTLTYIAKNAAGKYEYSYSKTDTSAKWENITNKVQYFYAVNKAGLICPNPIIIEFAANPVPQISSRSLNVNYNSSANKNFMNSSSTIIFVSDITLTKCEFYKGNSETPALTVPDGSYTLSDSNKGFELNASNLLSTFAEAEELTVKLYTATEESDKYELTKSGYASSNQFVYDAEAPVVKSLQVKGIRKGTDDRSVSSPEYTYWATDPTDLVDLYVTLVEKNTGVYKFDFAWDSDSYKPDNCTVKFTANTELYKKDANGTFQKVNNGSRDGNYYYINAYDDSLRDSTGGDIVIKFTNVQLQSTRVNRVRVNVYDNANAGSVKCSVVTLDDGETTIKDFYYDATNPSLNTFTLSDRAYESDGTYNIPVTAGYTNEEQVNTELNIESADTSSGLYQLKAIGATFVDSGTNKTVINIEPKETNGTNVIGGTGSAVPFTVSNEDGSSILTFSNNQVFKGKLKVTINNLQLPSGDGQKNVTIEAISLANKKNTTARSYSITLDKTPPVWVDGGIYVSSVNDSGSSYDTTKVYPHPISGGYAYGIQRSDGAYFYKNGSIYLRGNVLEDNLPDDNKYLRTTAYNQNYSYFNPSADLTVYVYDKAGNKTENKVIKTITDASAPSSIANYITFKQSMKGDDVVGKVFRGNESKYVIKNITENDVDPYKIIVKLNSAVDSSDENIAGTSYSTISGRPTAAYKELYETVSGSVNTNFDTANSPIEYFAVSLKPSDKTVTQVESALTNSDWIPILNTTPRTIGSKIKVTGGGIITIEMPKNGTCEPVIIHLKDGCGNVSSHSTEVSWDIDGNIDNGTYTVTFNGETYNSSETNVVIHSPYTGNGTGGMAVNNEVTYYNSNSTTGGIPKLTLKYADDCWLPDNVTSGIYSLQARLIAWTGSSAPEYEDFINTRDYKKYDSGWQEIITHSASDVGDGITIDFPALTSVNTSYQLWYAVEDAVANYKIVQVKNRASSSSTDVTNWCYDNTGPTVNIAADSTDVSYSKVNKVDSTYYYSDNSKITYTVRDARSGVMTSGADYQTYNTVDANDTSIIGYSGGIPYIQAYDFIGNYSTPLLSAGGTTWSHMNVTDISTQADNVTNKNLYGGNLGVNVTYDNTSGSYLYQIQMSYLAPVLYSTMPDISDLLGWKVVSDLTSFDKSGTAFYSSVDLQNGGTYRFTKNTDGLNSWSPVTKYFFAVNKAGLVNPTPIRISIIDNPKPVINTVTYNSVTKYGDENTNYIKTGSYVNVTVSGNPSKYRIISGRTPSDNSDPVETVVVEKTDLPSGNNIPLALETVTTAKTLYLIVSTATEDSEMYELKGVSNANSWLYDATAPVFALAESNPISNASKAVTGSDTYYVTNTENSNVTISFAVTESGSGIGKYEQTEGDGATYTTIELTEDNKFTFEVPETATIYNFRAVDKAGNESSSVRLVFHRDTTGPLAASGTITPTYYSDAAGTSTATDGYDATTSDFVIYYNADKVKNVKLTADNYSDNENGVGLPAAYLGYKVADNAEGLSAASVTWLSDLNLTITDFSKTYQLYIKDKLGNETALRTYVFDNTPPSGTISYTAATGTELVENTAVDTDTIYFNSSTVPSVTLTKGNDVKDARGLAVELYYNDASDDTKKITSTMNLPCVANESTTYAIIAKDSLGNTATLKTFVLDGRAPTGAVTYTDETGTKLVTSEGVNTICFNSSSVAEVTLVEDSEHPIKAAGDRSAGLYYQIGDGELTQVTGNKIPCPTGTSGLTATYKIWAVDAVGNKTDLGSYTLKGTLPSGSVTYKILKDDGNEATELTDSTGDYIRVDEAREAVIIKYNSSVVKTLKLTSSDITDCGAGSNIVVKEGETTVSSTAYTSGVEVSVALGADWTGDGKVYDVYAVDNVGNTTKLMTFNFKVVTAPSVENTQRPPYSGYQYVPTYPGSYNVNDNSNWILAFAADDNYTISAEATGVGVNDTNLWTYKNGKPDKQENTTGWTTRNVTDDSTLTLPFKKDTLATSKMWYALTYTSFEPNVTATVMTPPVDGWNEVSSDDITNGIITNVQIDRSKLTYLHTFIWAWYKDALGNISVYNVTYPTATGQNWWVSDTEGPAGTITWTVNNNDSSTYDISPETIDADGTFCVTIQLVKNVSTGIKLKPVLSDTISGLGTIKLDNSSDLNNNEEKNYNITTNAEHTIVATDKVGNTTTWKVTFEIKESKDAITPTVAANFFTRSITSLFKRGSEKSTATPVKTVQVFENHTLDTVDTVSEVVSKTNKASSKAKSKKSSAKKAAAKKESTNKAALVEKTVEKLAEQEPLVQSAIEVLETVEDTVKESVEVTKEESVTAKATVKAASKASAAVEPLEPSVQVQLEPAADSAEFDTFDIKLIFTLLAIIVAASGLLLAFVIKKVKNNG